MAKDKQPYIPFYTGDYLRKTRRLTLEVRGAWVDLLIFMWDSEERGTITGRMEEFALMMGCSLKKANTIISDLRESKICDFEVLSNGLIKLTSRRMVRDNKLSQVRKEAGSKGGNPNLVNQKSTTTKKNGYLISDNEYDNGINTKKEPQKLFDSYPSGNDAFEEIKSDELFVEQLVRVVRQEGFRACDEITAVKAVKKFLTIESAKPNFTRRPRDEIRSHLVNWVRSKAKTLSEHG